MGNYVDTVLGVFKDDIFKEPTYAKGDYVWVHGINDLKLAGQIVGCEDDRYHIDFGASRVLKMRRERLSPATLLDYLAQEIPDQEAGHQEAGQ